MLAEQVAMLYRQGFAIFLGSGFSGGVLVWLLWDEPVERRHLAIWLGVLFAVLALRWAGVAAYRASPRRMEHSAYWGWAFTVGAAASGCVWGYLGYVFFQPTLLFLLPITLVLSTQVALSVPSVGMFLQAHVCFNLLTMTPFVIRTYMEEGRLFLGQSFALLVFMVTCLLFAHRHQATIRDAIRLRFANLDLLAQLRHDNKLVEDARKQAEEANTAKTRFLAAASHDLRQPLQAITLFAHAVAQEVAAGHLPDGAVVGNLQSSCESLEMLLDSLLDLSRVEAGAIKPEIRAVPLKPLFDRIRREFADQAAAKELELRIVPTRVSVHSDPALLERMLRNLMVNALRYTERGAILVGCRRRGDRVRIEVRDSGIGIPEDELQAIFREFYQLGNPERDRSKGLGLGLSIVAALASQLDHDIDVRSSSGHGSIFAIELAEAPQVLPPAAIPAPLPDRLRGRLLAVIDDEAMIREAMTRLLSGWGCIVVAGEDADKVLAQLDGRAPDAILADWRLREGRLGTDEIARIRSHIGHAIPAVLITGDTAPDVARHADYPVIRKPVQGFRLRAELDALLNPVARTSPNV